jgi:hypothetical protein
LSWEHDQARWVGLDEFLKLDSIPKIIGFVKKYYQQY